MGRLLLIAALCTWAVVVYAKPFGVQVIDEQTGRGVPAVELKSTSRVGFFTDSAGWVAIDDPAMLGRRVYFDVSSDGYEIAPDGFGSHGVMLDIVESGERTVPIKRLNIAERLYRMTGEGIYRDSVMLGKATPISKPLLNAQVTGQDSAQCAIYQNKIWWFFGDTNRQSYRLGQYNTTGAISDLSQRGGLDPAVGVNLDYFTDEKGFVRAMVPPEKGELHWLDGLTVVPDRSERERLIGVVTRLQHLGKDDGQYLAAFDEASGMFQPLATMDVKTRRRLCGHPFHYTVDGVDYLYCGLAFATVRVRCDWKSVTDPSAYEALVPQGQSWSWQRGVEPMEWQQVEQGIKSGGWKINEIPMLLHDAVSGKPLHIDAGSVAWNEHRKKWTIIACQVGGASSYLGEIWYAEADQPQGPWHGAVKMVTHNRYSFYNPVQLPFFNGDGRYIFFQGTYSATFSRRESDAVPRYDYNQIMYRLDVDDRRLTAAHVAN